MYTLHPDKLLALHNLFGSKAQAPAHPIAPAPRPPAPPEPSLIQNLAARLYSQH